MKLIGLKLTKVSCKKWNVGLMGEKYDATMRDYALMKQGNFLMFSHSNHSIMKVEFKPMTKIQQSNCILGL